MPYRFRSGDNTSTVTITDKVEQVDTNTFRINLEIEYRGGIRKCHVLVPDFVAQKYRGKPGTYQMDIAWKDNIPTGVTFPGYINRHERLVVCKIHAS